MTIVIPLSLLGLSHWPVAIEVDKGSNYLPRLDRDLYHGTVVDSRLWTDFSNPIIQLI